MRKKRSQDSLQNIFGASCCHIPSLYESLVYYYEIYSSSYRGKEKRENANEEVKVEVEAVRGAGKTNSTWARLIQKIFEVDVLRCTKCGGEMKVIAFITEQRSVRKILDHIGEKTKRAPPLSPTITLTDADYGDYVPSDEVYAQDPEYVEYVN
ncbi:MAG: hypothetical protein GY941_30020 [Planctomycetes bacterium]|nr:hypothetical protein [Planctomycetota bacterium]